MAKKQSTSLSSGLAQLWASEGLGCEPGNVQELSGRAREQGHWEPPPQACRPRGPHSPIAFWQLKI